MQEEELSEGDRQWELCVLANKTYRDLWRELASNPTEKPWIVLGITKRNYRTTDDGYWRMVHAWIAAFVPRWEQQFRTIMEGLEPEDNNGIEAASGALNVAPELLTYFVNHKAEIEQFLEAQRPMLGLIAESKLWELIMQGDAATVRWFLERVRSDVYGKSTKETVQPAEALQTIEIVRG